MQFHFRDHLCDDLERISSKLFLGAAPCKNFNVVLERSYHRASMRRATRSRETASVLKPIVDRLEGMLEMELEKIRPW